MYVQIPASPKKLDVNDGQLDGRNNNKNNKDSLCNGKSHTKKLCLLVNLHFAPMGL